MVHDSSGTLSPSNHCSHDRTAIFRKRIAASLINVCVFFLAATIITAQVFFFSTTSSETLAEETKAITRRFLMGQKLELAFTALESRDLPIISNPASTEAAYANSGVIHTWIQDTLTYDSFDKAAKVWSDDTRTVFIYDLNYTLINRNKYYDSTDPWNNVPPPQRIFPPMSDDHQYFLVRVIGPRQGLGKKLMYQLLTRRSADLTATDPKHSYDVYPLTFQEVWYE